MHFDLESTRKLLLNTNISKQTLQQLLDKLKNLSGEARELWKQVSSKVLTPQLPFEVHRVLFNKIFENWNDKINGPIPVWSPSKKELNESNIAKTMSELNIKGYRDFHRWSVEHRSDFWEHTANKLEIPFKEKYHQVLDISGGVENPNWFQGAKLNIADSCFVSDSQKTAIVYQAEGSSLQTVTYAELNRFSNRVANGLHKYGFKPKDAIAIDMPMTVESVAIYLGIVKAGCVAVSIADSFAPEEIKTRLKISNAKGIFTQDFIIRSDKKLPLYAKVIDADAPMAVVIPCEENGRISLRSGDLVWSDFLSKNEDFKSYACSPNDPTNILFSSGTTGDPKAIAWTHLTPLKSAMDGYYHHDIRPLEVVAWPTNLGWMMGPWLIYASLINKATIALYYGAPTTRGFCQFVQEAKVNMLGLVPSVVKAWKNSDFGQQFDWSCVKLFSSTGECSNPEDYLYLMSLANYRPVIEYCGGTEIGGGYLTGTLLQDASPSTFTTPSLGLDLCVLDEKELESDNGEVFIIPPSVGLSQTLLNKDHFKVYYENTPKGPKGEVLRRHGDQVQKLANGYYQAQGRADDTMNLGGIKVSSAEIERLLNKLDEVSETAAIAVSPAGGGPTMLVIYATLTPGVDVDLNELKSKMQQTIKEDLNPLFKIQDLHSIESLPRTASNKVMRRVLRKKYSETTQCSS